ncbi:hypothetical protein ACFQH6_03700 [Halobacteriaceae archaeon GCM10025711]
MIEYETGSFPHLHTGFNQWVTWKYIDGVKQPFSPFSDLPRYTADDTPDSFAWSNPDNWTDFHTARKWARMVPDLEGVGFIIQMESEPYREPADPTVLIDFDDVINENGDVHPYVRMVLDRIGTYGDVSVSNTGIHFMGVGELPDDVRTIQGELPEHPDFPEAEIEVYDGKRFTAVTGKWIPDTPREVRDVSYWLKRFARRFSTTSKAVSRERSSDLEIDNATFDDVATTDNYDKLLDAIASVKPADIQLKSPVTNEQANGTKGRDPTFANSKSGKRLGELADGWVYRDGMISLDALQVVALEERIISEVGAYPSGEEFWRAVEALRERGASIPRYEGKKEDLHGLYGSATTDDEKARQFVKRLELLE